MKSFLLALTLSLLAVVLAAFDPSMPMQQSYELRCRGGGLKFNSTSGRSLASGEQMMDVTIDFIAGTQGAGIRKPNLNPGQCSWIDRGFRQGEPTQIRLEMVSFAQQQQARHGSPVDRSPTAAERYPMRRMSRSIWQTQSGIGPFGFTTLTTVTCRPPATNTSSL
jgi:hypothetical protein